jgi:thiol:disulfide interchange protein DsbD
MPKKIKLTALLILCVAATSAQIREPVKWKYLIDNTGAIIFHATVDKGWHLYDMNLPEGGPIPTSFEFETVDGAELSGKITTNSKIHSQYDATFGMTVRQFAEDPTFMQQLKITDSALFRISGRILFMACDNENCIPGEEDFFFNAANLSAGTVTIPTTIPDAAPTNANFTPTGYWTPVISDLQGFGDDVSTTGKSLFLIMLLGFGGGLLALITPCVWPVIPLTVSFFLKRSGASRRKTLADAAAFALSIIGIYLLAGLLITALFGAAALNGLATNAIFNLLFFALLLLFALSFFGAFDIALPASWSSHIDSRAESAAGLPAIFFMAFTLVLVSFSCTGPIIGTLLVEAAGSGSIVGPAAGMFGFAVALALPFALFALFPAWLKNLPRSGGWLNTVKVTLGFLELAFSLKFLSVADLAYGWRILDREVFLVLWIIIFALLGIYLLGKIKLPHDSDLPRLPVSRLLLATVSLAFALYLMPGLWGAPLKAVGAFLPPLSTQDFSLYEGTVRAKFSDYDEGMAYARTHNLPVMLDFTGYGCVNCREMEAAVLSDTRVRNLIDSRFVLISLYVDDKTRLDTVTEIVENGKKRRLKSTGDKWSYLQRYKFGKNAQPFYVLLDNNGKPLAPAHAYDKNTDRFLMFLQRGIAAYQ